MKTRLHEDEHLNKAIKLRFLICNSIFYKKVKTLLRGEENEKGLCRRC